MGALMSFYTRRRSLALSFATILFFATSGSSALAESALFTYKSKDYAAKDLPPKLQQSLYDLDAEYKQRVEALASAALIEMHLTELEKGSGKSREQVEASLFKVKDPTDKEMKDWFEANKSRLPPGYAYDQIKGDIKTLLKTEEQNKQRSELSDKLKKEGKFTLKLVTSEAPIAKIAIEGFPMKGAPKPKVTIVEFADYLCPHCKVAKDTLDRLVKKHPDVQLVFMDFPFKAPVSTELAKGAFCAGEQGKFWEFHDLAFDKQDSLPKDASATLAKDLKLNEEAFKKCLDSANSASHVAASKAEAERLGVSGTPSIFINGRRVRSYEEKDLGEEIEKALKEGRG